MRVVFVIIDNSTLVGQGAYDWAVKNNLTTVGKQDLITG